ncbi:MAG: hypothetical protein KJO07_26020 [Deltaproteobacteria bacterium]|nr:hypothetical protein [Deltaproteobacteria bacterium]
MAAQDTKDEKALEREARERYEAAAEQIREGSYRFASKLRGQASIILDELIDPEGEAVGSLADVEGDAGALALAIPIDLITFETWLFGQVGDQEELDLDIATHRELWFNYGAWIGETLKRRHGGHWLIAGEDPRQWRLGFSKIMLEIVPWTFAEQLIRLGSGCAQKMLSELERLRLRHEDQLEKDGGNEIDRFTAQHYVRMHTVPLGQWMVLDFATLGRLWNEAPTSALIKELHKRGPKLGEQHQPLVEKLVEALAQAKPDEPIAKQTNDRGLFEAIAQIVALRRTTAPIALDVLEHMVLQAIHMGIPGEFPPLDDDDLGSLRKGTEYFALMVDCVPHAHKADDEGLMGSIPHDQLRTPYADRNNLEIGKGDWVLVNPAHFAKMLVTFEPKKLLERYDEFVKYVSSNPSAPRRRDDGRMLAETVARALTDMKACVAQGSQKGNALLFRMLPPPG